MICTGLCNTTVAITQEGKKKRLSCLQHPVEHSQNDVGADANHGVGHRQVGAEIAGHLELRGPRDAPGPQVAPEEGRDGSSAGPVLREQEEGR